VDDQVIESGNPALEPEKVWTFEAGYERRLPGDGGRIDVRAFYDDITDAIDRFPFCRIAGRLEPVALCLAPTALGRLDSAFGNIASAKSYGVEGKASLRLGLVGLSDAVLSLRGLRRWSEVEDPFTDLDRRLAADRRYEYEIGFRHDLTAWRMSYGFTYKSIGVAAITSDLPFTNYFEVAPLLEAFVERRLTSALTLRVELQNLTHSYENRSRYLWDVAVGDGDIIRTLRRVEYFEERRDVRGAIRLRGSF
jgi:outer membrane receptor for ferrienterochelin and colicins